MWNGIGWYGFIGVITTSLTDISLRSAFAYICMYHSVDLWLLIFMAALLMCQPKGKGSS